MTQRYCSIHPVMYLCERRHLPQPLCLQVLAFVPSPERMYAGVVTLRPIMWMKPSSRRTSQASRGTDTDTSVKSHRCFWRHQLWGFGTKDWPGETILSPHYSNNTGVLVSLSLSLPLYPLSSMRECPQTPALKSCTSY